MKKFEKGPDKVNQICRILKQEALEPAKEESNQIVQQAHADAEKIKKEAQKEAEKRLQTAQKEIDQRWSVFQSSMEQATKQSLEALKQSILHKLLNDELASTIGKYASDPKVIAQFINAICTSIEKDGISANILAAIPKQVSPHEVTLHLLQNVLQRLKDKNVVVGDFEGGAQVKFVDKKMMIDLSDRALKDLLARYVHKDFRKLIFES